MSDFIKLMDALSEYADVLAECGCSKKKVKRPKKDDIERDDDGPVLDEVDEVEEGFELPACPSCGNTTDKLCCADSIAVAKTMKKGADGKYRKVKPEKKGAKEVGTGKKARSKVDQKKG